MDKYGKNHILKELSDFVVKFRYIDWTKNCYIENGKKYRNDSNNYRKLKGVHNKYSFFS